MIEKACARMPPEGAQVRNRNETNERERPLELAVVLVLMAPMMKEAQLAGRNGRPAFGGKSDFGSGLDCCTSVT